ncbi:MAG TPA: hypothetical protein VHZ78_00540 [Rhizomicrobium sp.]|jgi:hypothetical protein|nr:hypothetical protein [Rhizomicrobium sp.]
MRDGGAGGADRSVRPASDRGQSDDLAGRQYLAFSTAVGTSRAVVIKSIDDGKTLAGLGTGAQKLRDLTWAGSNHLLIMLSTTGTIRGADANRHENSMLENYNLTTHQISLVLGGVEGALNLVFSVP